jgi:hypothetical protein
MSAPNGSSASDGVGMSFKRLRGLTDAESKRKQEKWERKEKERMKLQKKVVHTVLTGSAASRVWACHSAGLPNLFDEIDEDHTVVYTEHDTYIKPIVGGGCAGGRKYLYKGKGTDEADEDDEDNFEEVVFCLHMTQREPTHHTGDSLEKLKLLTQEVYDHYVTILPPGDRVTIERPGEITLNTTDGVFDVRVEPLPY